MHNFLLIHGPNLNLLGRRDAHHYGTLTQKKLEAMMRVEAAKFQIKIKTFQSNHEGAIIDFIQKESPKAHGIIINPGALAHYSYALHDALLDAKITAVEVHLSDLGSRESWRKISVTAPACAAKFTGKKEQSYLAALNYLVKSVNVD